jgi:ubiquitin-conjugating enzyme E2 J2
MGKIKFPPAYPFKPPAIYMLTPNGRFETDRTLCLSMSEFHPESWAPAWSVSTIIKGVLSFMLEDEQTTGGLITTDATKRELAVASHVFNAAHADFRQLFAQPAGGAQAAPPAGAAPAPPAAPPAAAKKR